jgi:30S ribosomal protein S31
MSPASFIFAAHKKFFFVKTDIIMGRGDKKTRRGKISMGSFGKTRPARAIVRKTATETKDKKAGE